MSRTSIVPPYLAICRLPHSIPDPLPPFLTRSQILCRFPHSIPDPLPPASLDPRSSAACLTQSPILCRLPHSIPDPLPPCLTRSSILCRLSSLDPRSSAACITRSSILCRLPHPIPDSLPPASLDPRSSAAVPHSIPDPLPPASLDPRSLPPFLTRSPILCRLSSLDPLSSATFLSRSSILCRRASPNPRSSAAFRLTQSSILCRSSDPCSAVFLRRAATMQQRPHRGLRSARTRPVGSCRLHGQVMTSSRELVGPGPPREIWRGRWGCRPLDRRMGYTTGDWLCAPPHFTHCNIRAILYIPQSDPTVYDSPSNVDLPAFIYDTIRNSTLRVFRAACVCWGFSGASAAKAIKRPLSRRGRRESYMVEERSSPACVWPSARPIVMQLWLHVCMSVPSVLWSSAFRRALAKISIYTPCLRLSARHFFVG